MSSRRSLHAASPAADEAAGHPQTGRWRSEGPGARSWGQCSSSDTKGETSTQSQRQGQHGLRLWSLSGCE